MSKNLRTLGGGLAIVLLSTTAQFAGAGVSDEGGSKGQVDERATVVAVGPEVLPGTGFAADLDDTEIAHLVGEAFYWGMNIAGHYEMRFVNTQMEQHPAFNGLNRVRRQYQLADASARYATTINASTLYSGGAFDVAEEPVVIEAEPVTDGRYWSIQASDQYANWFLMVGSQFTGNGSQRYLVVGPDWRGHFPSEFRSTQIIRASSNTFNIVARVAVTTRTAEDLAGARKVIDGISAGPLGLWLTNDKQFPPLAEQPKIRGQFRSFPRMEQIVDYGRTMTAVDFLQLLSLSINDARFTRHKDSALELATLARLAPLGLREGELLDPGRLSPAQVDAAQVGFEQARRHAHEAMQAALIDMNGWQLQSSLFCDDLDYPAKAGSDDVAWGTPVPYQSHTIAYLFKDSRGKPLDGNHRYTLTLDLASLPPVTEFWELPVYDSAGYFIPNPINRNSVTSYQLAAGDFAARDGKVTFYLQPDQPADPEQAHNWLPTARGDTFQFAARFYGPMAGLVDGSYAMPQVVQIE